MRLYYEYRSDVARRGPPKLMPKEDMEGLQGFTSIYGFDADVAEVITQRRGTWGLAEYPLYSDLLYIDVDKDSDLINEVKDKLSEMHITFSMYESGSPDSAHFHIPLVPMHGTNIQYIQKQWVRDHFGEEVDLSIYKTSGIIRLPGSFHKKHPGRYKKLVHGEGYPDTLDLNGYEVEVEIQMPKSRTIGEDVDKEGILDSLLMSDAYEKSGDGRHNTIFKIAALANDVGWDKQKTTEVLLSYNQRLVNPKVPAKDIFTTINSAYRRRG